MSTVQDKPMQETETVILTEADIERTLKRLTHELLEANQGCDDLILLGIVTRGDILAKRIGALVSTFESREVPVGHLDITLYRDDTSTSVRPAGESHIPVDITGKRVVLIDDVLFSGRTVRAALDALNAYGRPASVQLMVLLDRGHRQLPIRPDFVGKNVPTALEDRVKVCIKGIDESEQVTLCRA